MATLPVVAGVDGSEESLRAVEWAALEAQRHQAPLRIVSAPALLPRMRAHDAVPQAVADALHDESVLALREAVTRSTEVTARPLIDAGLLSGPPALAVTDSGSGALMLVVGALGAGGFAALLLGSVSRYAAMHAACPVVVVREETSAVHREVVVGIRDPRSAMAALDFAFDEAALRGAILIAVHAGLGGHPAVEAERSLAEALAPWRDKYPGVRVRQEVVHGNPARVLAAYTGRADLVVIGRRGRDAALAVGAVKHAVLSHARGPVAIVPDDVVTPGLDSPREGATTVKIYR